MSSLNTLVFNQKPTKPIIINDCMDGDEIIACFFDKHRIHITHKQLLDALSSNPHLYHLIDRRLLVNKKHKDKVLDMVLKKHKENQQKT